MTLDNFFERELTQARVCEKDEKKRGSFVFVFFFSSCLIRDHLKNINYHKFYYNFMQTKAYYTLVHEMRHFKRFRPNI